jgi:ABC-2 type transport system ATP-binding protein
LQIVEVGFSGKVDGSWFLSAHISRAEQYQDKWQFYTEDPDQAIEHIVRVKEQRGLKILTLGTSGPTLEDVFVKLCEVNE